MEEKKERERELDVLNQNGAAGKAVVLIGEITNQFTLVNTQ